MLLPFHLIIQIDGNEQSHLSKLLIKLHCATDLIVIEILDIISACSQRIQQFILRHRSVERLFFTF